MIIALMCLLFGYYFDDNRIIIVAMICLIVNIVKCTLYKPIAAIWINISHIIGSIISLVIMSILFLRLVVPVGVFRRLIGIDSLSLNQWKKNNLSVFKIREHTFEPVDLNNPY
jgi:hypothetical protein